MGHHATEQTASIPARTATHDDAVPMDRELPELHDKVTDQSLINILIETARRKAQQCDTLARLVNEMAAEMRELIEELRQAPARGRQDERSETLFVLNGLYGKTGIDAATLDKVMDAVKAKCAAHAMQVTDGERLSTSRTHTHTPSDI